MCIPTMTLTYPTWLQEIKTIFPCNLNADTGVIHIRMQYQPEDIDIIRTVLSGRQQAYTLLVERYQKYVFTLTLRFVGDRELAEELAQDVFVKAYRSLADYRGESKFSTWLYTIVHSICISALRKKQHPVVLTEDLTTTYAAIDNQTQKLLDTRSDKAQLTTAISLLDPTDAEVIILFYQAEQSIEEIGHITGQTPGSIKVRLHRARQRLRNILTTRYPSEFKDSFKS